MWGLVCCWKKKKKNAHTQKNYERAYFCKPVPNVSKVIDLDPIGDKRFAKNCPLLPLTLRSRIFVLFVLFSFSIVDLSLSSLNVYECIAH